MKFTSLLILAFSTGAIADTAHWEFSESTGGEDVHWMSPTAVDPNADEYAYTYEITYVGVDVVFLGVVIGPEDVTNQIDADLRFGTGIVQGPSPFVFMNEPLEADADSDGDIDVAAHFYMHCNGKGFGQFDVTEVFLGDVYADTGWPFGWQYVDIDRIYMDGYMDMTPIYNPCPEDTNADDMINVTDVLNVIGNWGGSGIGDVDGSGIVDVSDLLAIVGAWGPC